MTQIPSEELSAHPVVAKDWSDYQPGSIVSRNIIQQPTGTVTHFAFDAGKALSEHTAPFDALVQVIDGEGEITIAGRSLPVKTGEMILLPANKPHAVKANQRFKMLITMIRS